MRRMRRKTMRDGRMSRSGEYEQDEEDNER